MSKDLDFSRKTENIEIEDGRFTLKTTKFGCIKLWCSWELSKDGCVWEMCLIQKCTGALAYSLKHTCFRASYFSMTSIWRRYVRLWGYGAWGQKQILAKCQKQKKIKLSSKLNLLTLNAH